MRISRVYLRDFRSLETQEFEIGPFTVLFGKNNAGKTNILEAIYGLIAPMDLPDDEDRLPGRGLRGGGHVPAGGLYVQLEPGWAFDDQILKLMPDKAESAALNFQKLPLGEVCFARHPKNESLPGNDTDAELWFVDVRDYYDRSDAAGSIADPESDELCVLDRRTRLVTAEPLLNPLFLGWEFSDIDEWTTSAIADLTAYPIYGYPTHKQGRQFLEPVTEDSPFGAVQIRPAVKSRIQQLALLATDLLPDFLDGAVEAEVELPTGWDGSPRVRLFYRERGSIERCSLEDAGRGASRWLAIAVQVALHLMRDGAEQSKLNHGGPYFGHVLFIDEPEAHLHPAAVASIVRWCERLVATGFHLIAASHHDEFLRAPSELVTFVKVSRESRRYVYLEEGQTVLRTRARTLPVATISTLQELAAEIGMHPAAALSLHRAILFVEGPLDEAVLDEYAGPALDAAGVAIIPMHGTKNLEGLIDGEFPTRLGIKTGVLTDNTDISSIWDRSHKKRSGEEKKLVKLLDRFEAQGAPPPTLFGVQEHDLLFALPPEAIRSYLGGPFPSWHELREECREAEGRGPSDSVDWKSYALERYGLPITTNDGVRRVIRALDLDGVELTSIRKVINDIIAWAREGSMPSG